MKKLLLMLALCTLTLTSCFNKKDEDPQPMSVQPNQGQEYFGTYQNISNGTATNLTISKDSMSFDILPSTHFAYPGTWLNDSTFKWKSQHTPEGKVWTIVSYVGTTLTVESYDIQHTETVNTTVYIKQN